MARTARLLLALVALLPACRRAADQARPAPDAAPAARAAAAPQDAAALPPNYDPTALVRGGAEPLEVFANEPRNLAWAGAVEAALGEQMRKDLKRVVPEARGVGLSCRTLSCLVLVDAPKDKLPVAVEVVSLVTLGPITVNLGLTPDGKAQVLFLTEPRFSDPAKFVSWYRNVRLRTLEEIRAGKEPNPLPVPPDVLLGD